MRKTLGLLVLAIALIACAKQPADSGGATQSETAAESRGAQPTAAATDTSGDSQAAPTNAPLVAIPNARQYQGMLVGGAPTDENLAEIAKAGYHTVIDLRTPIEPGVEAQQKRVTELNMSSVSIPTAGAEGLTKENVDKLDNALNKQPGPVVLHCGSGNRVGALLALRAFWMQGKTADEALAVGKASGLTSLEAEVKRILEQ